MEDKALAKELDQWIACLQECKQLEESHVKILCDKVRDHKNLFGMGFCFFNPQRMCENYSSRVCVCVSVTALAVTYYLVFTLKTSMYNVGLATGPVT